MTLVAAGVIAVLAASCAAGPRGRHPQGRSPAIASVPTASSVAPSAPPVAPTPSGGPVNSEGLVMEQLFLAIGNPDTGSTSEAWTDFNETLKEAIAGRGDPERIRATAQVVLDYVDAAQSALDAAAPTAREVPAPTPPLVSWDWKQEWGAMLTAISEGVAAMRDGGIAADVNTISAGATRMNDALLDHFYPQRTWTSPDGLGLYASGTRLNSPPGNAFDRQAETSWSAGDRPLPGWIEIDLGKPITVEGVRLLTSQNVAGPTVHQVTGRTADGREVSLARFQGSTRDDQWLEQTLAKRQADIRFVRVTTEASPAVIAWREIEILSSDLPLPSMAAAPTPRPRPTPAPRPSAVPVESRLADGRVIRASSATAAGPPSGPFDGQLDTGWNAGTFPVAWIEIDFGHQVAPTAIRLMPSQSPNGHTIHNIYGRAEGQSVELLLYTFDGVTNDGVWMSADLASPGPIRYLRIETTTSPSWVAWFEIEVTTAP